ncbi:MAG TPA: hypothetical protein VLA16_27770 [Ideonella sp.]|nr:hypothetical protein [Ideonella sp.]
MIAMQRIGRRAGFALAGLALSAVCWWIAGADDSPLPSVPRAAAAHPEAAAFAAAPATVAVATHASLPLAAAAPPPPCPGQSMTLMLRGHAPERRCAAPTRTQRTGETWVHEVQSSGGPQGWTLRIETIGGQAHRLTLTAADGRRHGCTREHGGCAGVVLDDGDALSPRRMVLDNTLLQALPPPRPKGMRAADVPPSMFSADPAAAPVHVSAELSVPAGDAGEPPCAGPVLTLVSSTGKVTSFCGEAGNEQGSLPDGGERVGLLAHGRPPLRIHLDATRQVVRVEMGPLACEASACTGAVIEDAGSRDPEGMRSVSFAGTTLMRAGAGGSAESVVVNGRLPIP